jgi:hypothetical protein
MPRARIAMRKVKEVLRLRYDLRLSYSQIRVTAVPVPPSLAGSGM